MEFKLTVNVQLGVTPELVSLVTAIMHQPKVAPVEAPAIAPAIPAAAPAPVPVVEQPAEQPAAPAPGPVVENKALTEEDIRAAMHRTRQRIEGADYRENTDSELYKKYHRQLTGEFKRIAAILGADKPSALPAEQRASFIAQCDELIIDEKGEIAVKLPF